jgi:imidazoleglycerol-phosphate dehydratase/histidinol-phosphatase
MKNIIFVDRDGTILEEPRDYQVDSLEKMEFVPGIISGLQLLQQSGYTLILVSNQDGLGTSKYPRKSFDLVQAKMLGLLEGEGVHFDRIFICPHFERQNCACRKPKVGLIPSKVRKLVDLSRSFVLGDRLTDVEFAENLGVRSVRLLSKNTPRKKSAVQSSPKLRAEFETSNALEACRYIAASSRSCTVFRNTNETKISASVKIDGRGQYDVETGIPFFNHMIEQLAKHSGMDLKLHCRGDIGIDAHHTVEDVGIVLGEAIRQALGAKKGIRRYGFVLPMDEARCEVLIDLSGRGHLEFEAEFKRPDIGGLPSELVEDFFIALSGALPATVHIRSQGRNDHHKIEGIFKAFAKTLGRAFELSERARDQIPSTKGSL